MFCFVCFLLLFFFCVSFFFFFFFFFFFLKILYGDANLTLSEKEQVWQTLSPQCYIPRLRLKVFLVLEKKIFKVFLPYMDMVAILFNGVKPFEQYPFDRRPQVKPGENWSSGFRE